MKSLKLDWNFQRGEAGGGGGQTKNSIYGGSTKFFFWAMNFTIFYI